MTSFFAGSASCKKRGRDTETAAANNKRHKTARSSSVLVTAPGAGGMTSKHAKQLFEELSTRYGMTVCRMDDKEPVSWNKFTPNHTNNMKALLASVQRVSKAHPDKRILLCGHSFGCRVVAEAMRIQRKELLQECNVMDAMICLGYPLLKSGVPETDPNNVKRAAHLQQLPSSVKTLIVQGERDNLLGPRGMASLNKVLKDMEETHDFTLVDVPKCGHDLTAKVVPQVREAILEFALELVSGKE